ncbi:endo-1,3-alpha-glucanase family glycosylhydrolase [Pseudactinotalea suaedae]|uniref:endo-1,3-alpha-glucanase family glycosylhydrolase n=1 Tax=Pseudactinotalea suaedae TaxID=1524924 RepID=UPI0019D5EEB6|nr:endo-1,3-alpha-glucanase family glycosylhydrolase [Pseudactinotalea suaedae]
MSTFSAAQASTPAARTAVTATTAAADAPSATLRAADAGWTTSRAPDTPQRINGLSVTAGQDRTYLKFDGQSLEGHAVTSATLVLRVRSTTATQPGVVVYPTSADWSSSTLTRSNQPERTGPAVSEPSPAPQPGAELRIPVDVEAISTDGTFGLRLEFVQRYIRLLLERHGADAPRLELSLTPAAAPAPVTPSVPAPTPEPEPEPVVPTEPEPAPVTPTQPDPEPVTPGEPEPEPAPAPGAPSEPEPAPRPDGGPLVFAHYFTPYPLSLDNKPADSDYYARNYLDPSGENGKFAEWGGLLRDRPLSPGASKGDWEVANFVTEIEQAQSAGIDGWTLDLLSSSGRNWTAALQVMEAADQVGDFYVVPMVDATATFSDGSPESVAALLSQLYEYDSAYQEEDGEYLLSSFKAEGKPVSWWKQVIASLESKHGLPITFQALFLDASDANMRSFAPIADGFSNWGTRTEHGALTRPDYAARAAALDRTWMEPVAVQDIRYKDARWAEASNTAGVRAQWERAITQGADYVQIVTWNDYSESTQVAPSMAHGTAFLDLMRYYVSWYHTGSPPAITSDEVVLTHRTQFVDARPSFSHNLMGAPTLGGTSTAPRDTVEALVWLTAPATVEVTVGGTVTRFEAPAGVSAHTVPLELGTASVTVDRGGAEVAALVSPHEVVARPYVQDLQYWAASSW